MRAVQVMFLAGAMALTGCAGKAARNPSATAPATRSTGPIVSKQDAAFLVGASQFNRFEIEVGRTVASRAKTDRVRNLARLIWKDHEESGVRVVDAAADRNVPLSADFSAPYSDFFARLDPLAGPDLEREFLNQQVHLHRELIRTYTAEADHGDDPGIRAVAQEALAEMREHLNDIERLRPGTWRTPSTAPTTTPAGR